MAVCRQICGEEAFKNIILCTNMWDTVKNDRDVGKKREKQLIGEFWADMLHGGSIAVRHDGSRDSGLRILKKALEKAPIPLRIQLELVNECKALGDTAAGKQVRAGIDALKLRYERELAELRAEAERGQEHDEVMMEKMRSDMENYNTTVGHLEKDAHTLTASKKVRRQQLSATCNLSFSE